MKTILSVSILFMSLLACTAESSDYDPKSLLNDIAVIKSEKSGATDRKYWRGLLKWDDECESGFRADESSSGLDVYSGGEKRHIIQVTCSSGAYQGYQRFYHLVLEGDTTIAKALEFPLYAVSSSKAVRRESSVDVWGNVLMNSGYDALTVLNQYSGYGNCGTLTTYRLVDGNVNAVRFRSEPNCESETASRNPENWPEFAVP